MEKRCPHCEEIKPVEQFYRSKRKVDGRDAYCKSCRDGLGAKRRAQEWASRPVPTPPTHKSCSRCGEIKRVVDFYRGKGMCKSCCTDAHREYVQQPEVAARILQQERNRAAGKWKRPPRRQPISAGYEICTMCNLDKPLDEFHKHKLGRSGVNATCKQCNATLSRLRRENPEIRQRENDQRRVRLFGLRPGQYDEMLEAQEGVCAICHRQHEDEKGKRLHIDHDHGTGAVRGLLCYGCNAGLGFFREDPDILDLAIRYLKGT